MAKETTKINCIKCGTQFTTILFEKRIYNHSKQTLMRVKIVKNRKCQLCRGIFSAFRFINKEIIK